MTSHPSDGELFDLRRGEVDEERAAELHAHIRDCARCADLWRELEALEADLDAFVPAAPSAAFTERTMAGVKDSLWGPPVGAQGDRPRGSGLLRWSRRLAWAAGIVGATLLFQAGVWSPLPATAIIQPMLSLNGAGGAQAAADSTLVVTVHAGPLFECALTEGRLGREAFSEALEAADIEGRYTMVQFLGADPDASVELRETDLRPIAEAAGVDHLAFGDGIVAIMEGPSLRSRVGDPQRSVALSLYRGDEQGSRVVSYLVITETDSARTASRVAIRPRRVAVPVEVRTSESGRVFSVVSVAGDLRLSAVASGDDEARIREMLEPERVHATVTGDGSIMLDIQRVDPEEFERALRELHRLFPDMGLTILEREGSTGTARLVQIANRVGMPSVSIKTVKK